MYGHIFRPFRIQDKEIQANTGDELFAKRHLQYLREERFILEAPFKRALLISLALEILRDKVNTAASITGQ